MSAEFVSPAQVAGALGVSTRAVNMRAKKEGWKAEQINKRDRRFPVAALPVNVQIAVRPQLHVVNKNSNIVPIAVGSPELADWQNRIALARTDLIRGYLAAKEGAKKQGRSKVEAGQLYIKGYNTGHLLPKIFEVLGKTSFQSVERWVSTFKRESFDYTALAPKWGGSKGFSKVTDVEFNTALSFMLHPNRLRISEVTRLTKMALNKRGIESPSHEDTIRRSLNIWKKQNFDQYVFCRRGEKALNDQVLPYIERDVSLLDVGEVLVADGHVLNFQCLHPFTGKPARMMLVMWYDWASNMPVGWEIMPTENIQCVAAGLRRAILALGKMPKVAYLDNGKAFKAKIFTDPDIDFEEAGFYGMFARLGIETLFAWPYNAASKVVERWFGTFNELERLMPTYSGRSIEDKPAHMLRNEKLHKKIHDKKYGGWVPTIEEANQIITGWVAEYAQRPHRGLKGLRPADVCESGRGPGVDESALRYLMMSMEIKNVGRQGVRFLGRNYYDDALYGYRDRVLVRYDLEDLSTLYIYDVTGAKLICEARPTRQVHPVARISGTKDDMAALKEGIKHKRGLKKATERLAREYVEGAPELVAIPARIDDRPSDAKAMEGRGRRNLPQAEAERIEREVAEMKVLELKPKNVEPVYLSEADRYEALLEAECRGEALSTDAMQFMRYFEGTDMYRTLKDRFEFLREEWLLDGAFGIGD